MQINLVYLLILFAFRSKMKQKKIDKLKILASVVRYDVSCTSNGSNPPNTGKGLGNSAP